MIQIVPAIDIIDGQCVRLTQGDYNRKQVYRTHAAEMAREFLHAGIRHIHVVDLDGAKSQHIVNTETLKEIASTGLSVDFGGGIKTEEDIELAFAQGAAQVTVGSMAVRQPELFLGWLKKYGPEKLILGADVKNGFISINGWKEESREALIPFLEKFVRKGVRYVLCTDISRDGMLQGPAVELYRQIQAAFPELQLIASGGVHSMDDVRELDRLGLYAVVTGKAIYEGKITLEEIHQFLNPEDPC